MLYGLFNDVNGKKNPPNDHFWGSKILIILKCERIPLDLCELKPQITELTSVSMYCLICCCSSSQAMFENVVASWWQNTGPLQWFVFIVFWMSQPTFPSEHREKHYRIVEVWRDLFKSPGPASCSRVVNESWLSMSMSRWLFNITRDGDSTTPLSNLGQCLVTLMGTL